MDNQMDIKWVAIGAIMAVALNVGFQFVLAEPLALPLLKSMGLIGGLLVFTLIIVFLSFFPAGLVIGRFSNGAPGKESGLAAVVGVGLVMAVNFTIGGGGRFNFLGLAILLALAYLLTFLGAKVGEKMKGSQPA